MPSTSDDSGSPGALPDIADDALPEFRLEDDPPIDREGWEPVVAAMISAYTRSPNGNSRRHTKTLLTFLADLLERDLLPKSGRDFLVEKQRLIASGKKAFPRQRERRATHTRIETAMAVARLRYKRRDQPMSDIYKEVAGRWNMSDGTIIKDASLGRAEIRENIEWVIATTDLDRDVAAGKVADLYAQWYGVPAEVILTFNNASKGKK